MDNDSLKTEEVKIPDVQVNSMTASAANIAPPSSLPVAPISNARPLGMPGMNIDPNLASRVNQSNQSPRRINIKLAAIIAVIVLFLGGAAYAWFFTDLRYKLPWFKVSEDKLVGLMYESLAKLDGTDFSVSYQLAIGDRDDDVKVDQKKISDREAYSRATELKYDFEYDVKNYVLSCLNSGGTFQAFAGQNCDGSNKAKPKVGDSVCLQAVNANVNNNTNQLGNGDFGAVQIDTLGTSRSKWPELKKLEWEYDEACVSDPTKKTFSFSLHSTYNDDKITCTEKKCTYNNEALVGLGVDSSFNFLFGAYLMELDEYITDNFDLQVTFAGSGFSLKEREEEKNQLPNVELSVDAKADLGDMTAEARAAAKIVDDFVYYKVSKFPFIDLTQGHKDEWIKIGFEDSDFVSDLVPDWNEDQVEAIKKFRDLIGKTKDYNVLEFKKTGKYSEKHGVKSPLFEVSVLAENIPSWLEGLRAVYNEAKDNGPVDSTNYDEYLVDDFYDDAGVIQRLGGVQVLTEEPMSEKDKQNLVAQVKKMMTNLKLSVALHPVTGDLMEMTVNFRMVPPDEVKKFATKQFNSTVVLEMWNQNNPTTTKAPDKYIDSSEIEREKLGLSKEAYNDVQQAERIKDVRQDLAKYYNKNRVFPNKLSEATKLLTDYNTNKEYEYKTTGNNYNLVYQMNDVVAENDTDSYDYKYNRSYYTKNMGSNTLTRKIEDWDKGSNIADRYSAVSQKYNASQSFLLNKNNNYDKDVFIALSQSSIVYKTGNALQEYYRSNKRYPDNLEALWSSQGYNNYFYGDPYYNGENILSGKAAEYKSLNNGSDYSIKFDFSLPQADINNDIIYSNKNAIVGFTSGVNEYNKLTIANTLYAMEKAKTDDYTDTDKDGLTNAQEKIYGTNPNIKDTDGDSYWDGDEVKNGYNPNGSGKLNEPTQVDVNTNNIKYDPITAADWVRGDSKATISLIIYSDADCPYCAKFHDTSNQILKDYAGKVKIIYRHFPLASLHPSAPKKAEAIECVGELGGNTKVWLFLDKLFATTKPTVTQLGDTAAAIGVDKTKFQTCLDSGKYTSKVSTQATGAQKAGAQGTPYSLLIKGANVIPVNGAYPYEEVKKLIDSLLK